MKKVLSALLCAAMLVSLMPQMNAMAAEEIDQVTVEVSQMPTKAEAGEKLAQVTVETADAGYTMGETQWYIKTTTEDDKTKWEKASGKYAAGETYMIQVKLTAEEGNTFAEAPTLAVTGAKGWTATVSADGLTCILKSKSISVASPEKEPAEEPVEEPEAESSGKTEETDKTADTSVEDPAKDTKDTKDTEKQAEDSADVATDTPAEAPVKENTPEKADKDSKSTREAAADGLDTEAEAANAAGNTLAEIELVLSFDETDDTQPVITTTASDYTVSASGATVTDSSAEPHKATVEITAAEENEFAEEVASITVTLSGDRAGEAAVTAVSADKKTATVEFAFAGHTHTAGEAWVNTDPDTHWKECTTEGCDVKLEEADHNWDAGTVTKEATVAEKGVKTYTCGDCGAEKTEDIAKLAPVASVSLTVTAPVKGAVPAATATAKENTYTVKKVTWSPAVVKFEPAAVYKVTVELETTTGFDRNATAFTINNEAVKVEKAEGTKAIISYTFNPTEGETYSWKKGNGSSWYKKSKDGLTITCEGPYDKFKNVLVDGAVVKAENYTVMVGSTVVCLKPAYLNTLKDGEHTISFEYTDGKSEDGKFTIKAAKKSTTKSTKKSKKYDNVPPTGDASPIMLWVLVMAAGFCGMAAGLYGSKRRFDR